MKSSVISAEGVEGIESVSLIKFVDSVLNYEYTGQFRRELTFSQTMVHRSTVYHVAKAQVLIAEFGSPLLLAPHDAIHVVGVTDQNPHNLLRYVRHRIVSDLA